MEDIQEVVTMPQETEVAQEVAPQETTQEQVFKVKHLHEEKSISYDEAPTYIQKGLDYDRVKGKYEESKPLVGFVEKLASQNGMSVPDYLKAVEEYEKQQEIETIASQKNLDPELAEELYLSRQERKQRQEQETQRQQADREKQEYLDFLNEFPEISKPEDVPQEVWEIKKNNPNLTITDAYIRHERGQLKAKLSAQETNKANAESSTGSVTGNGTSAPVELSDEAIEKMTPQQRISMWGEIKKFYNMK